MTVPVGDVVGVLDGAVDLHCHSGPSPFPRVFDHVQAARDAGRLNMAAILVKSHHHNTVMDVLAMAEPLAGVSTRVFGGIVLNSQVGGVNPDAVAMCLRMGGRGVWMPTFGADCHIAAHPEGGGFPTSTVALPSHRVAVRDESGGLLPAVHEVVDLVADTDSILFGGHLFAGEIAQLFGVAAGRGVNRLVVNHPNFVVGADQELCRRLVSLGAFVEHEVGQYDPLGNKKWDIGGLLDWITAIGPEHTVLASDLGQRNRPLPVDAYVRVGARLLELGLPEKDLHRIAVTNPAFLIGLTDRT